MLTRHPTRRTRLMVAALALAISAALAASGTAVAHHNKSFGMTGCVNASGDLVLTATWSKMHVTFWSFFIESSDGSGGLHMPVPTPGNSGTVTNTFTELDPATVSSLSASVFRGPTGGRELATGTLTQRPAGWPPCATHNNTFGMTACATTTGELVLTATWTRMRVTDWSYFIEHPDGSGGTFQPVPVPGRSGTVTQSFEGDIAATESIRVSFFNGSGQELATGKLTRRPAGWPPC